MKKIFFSFVFVLAITDALSAQSQTTSAFPGYFPEAIEIDASSRVLGTGFEGAADLMKVAGGRLASDVGFTRYQRVDYSGASQLSVEVFTLLDFKAAHSLLTLLRENSIQYGPPGDAFAVGNDGFLFSQGRFFVRISGKGASKELLEKTAAVVGSKMPPSGGERPELLDYFPSNGYDASGLRYFPSPDAYKTWTAGKAPDYMDIVYDVEIATAGYNTGGYSGTVYLLKFPTHELAEEYYDELAVSTTAASKGLSIYARRAGPVVAALEGNFDPVSAAELLSEVNFSYSMRWVYGDEDSYETVWGVPGVVLSAVVYSLFFCFIAIAASVVIGLAIGYGRFALRQYREKRSPNPVNEDTGHTWLILGRETSRDTEKTLETDGKLISRDMP